MENSIRSGRLAIVAEASGTATDMTIMPFCLAIAIRCKSIEAGSRMPSTRRCSIHI